MKTMLLVFNLAYLTTMAVLLCLFWHETYPVLPIVAGLTCGKPLAGVIIYFMGYRHDD